MAQSTLHVYKKNSRKKNHTFEVPGYKTVRRDRQDARKGGLAILVQNSISYLGDE